MQLVQLAGDVRGDRYPQVVVSQTNNVDARVSMPLFLVHFEASSGDVIGCPD